MPIDLLTPDLPSVQDITIANQARAKLYRWFADLFAQELTPALVEDWSNEYVKTHQVFDVLDLQEPSARLQRAIGQLNTLPKHDRALELAADFAHMFLLSGKESAPPYASFYLDDEHMLFGQAAQQMRIFLREHQLALNPEFKEPDDHISVYLHFMALWLVNNKSISTQDAEDGSDMGNVERKDLLDLQEQAQFLEDTLLSWLPAFNQHCQNIKVKTDVYPAIANLLEQFIEADVMATKNLA